MTVSCYNSGKSRRDKKLIRILDDKPARPIRPIRPRLLSLSRKAGREPKAGSLTEIMTAAYREVISVED